MQMIEQLHKYGEFNVYLIFKSSYVAYNQSITPPLFKIKCGI